jgi:Ran GTPase-activating protein (RanGAP) involved in mRNA processing and transport
LAVLFESEALNELRLSSNNLNDNSMEELSSFFYRPNCQLKKIDLSSNKITYKGARSLFQGLKQNQFLTHLNLENNVEVGEGELSEIKHFLNTNEHLQTLNLSNCGIKASHIGDMIEGMHAKSTYNPRSGNNTLKVLNLSDNRIKSEGAVFLASILENNSNTGLRVLDISKNSIEDEACVTLAKALETNSHLTKLSLKSNFICDEGGKAFLDCFQANKNLIKLCLDRNSIKTRYIVQIKEYLVENYNIATQKQLPKALEEMEE